ncbi:MAG: hypothetical protein JSW40_03540 [Candidatus Omnitrophota bacterium]|nr:MAG: hypothetical protein JSW40_03540 [Candidatus Omnitrophota bacterium]
MYRCRTKELRGGFFTLLGVILAIIIILILCSTVLNTYFKKSSLSKEEGNSFISQDKMQDIEHEPDLNIDTSTYQSIEESMRGKIKDIQKERFSDLERQMDGF